MLLLKKTASLSNDDMKNNRPISNLKFVWKIIEKACLANFIYGRVEAKVLSHVTFMPVLLRPVNYFLGQVIENASEGKYNTVNNSSSGEVTFQKCLNKLFGDYPIYI